MKLKKYIPLTLVIALIIPLSSSQDRYFEISKNIEIFTSLFRELNDHYVDDVDPNEIMRIGIDAMLSSLDPFTTYLAKADLDDYRLQTTGKYGGIGARIGKIDDYVTITEPYEGFPAHKAGLMAGDAIIEIDGKSAKGYDTQEVSQILRGQPGTDVKVKIYRAGTDETLDKILTRGEVKINNVPYYGMLNDKIGYIKLSNFAEKAGKEVGDALTKLKEENQIEGVVLDLRGNGGGLLHEAINVSNVFVDRGIEIVSTKGKIAETEKKYTTLNKPIDAEIPLIVLTDGGSASASEIVSGSIQDLDRGVVIGQQTYGKGLVQITRPVAYNARLKVTTSKYYIPSGRCIQAIDYSNRTLDERATKIPDSLRREFKTSKGRIVKDGAGIEPDLTTELEEIAHITRSLYRKDHIFRFATEYFFNNKELKNGAKFNLSEKGFEDFVAFLDGKDYDYETNTEKQLERLREIAENENYHEALSDAIGQLEEQMKHDKKRDLYKYKDEIIRSLEIEIASRYFYQKGRIESSLKDDIDVLKAIDIFTNKAKYIDILAVK